MRRNLPPRANTIVASSEKGGLNFLSAGLPGRKAKPPKALRAGIVGRPSCTASTRSPAAALGQFKGIENWDRHDPQSRRDLPTPTGSTTGHNVGEDRDLLSVVFFGYPGRNEMLIMSSKEKDSDLLNIAQAARFLNVSAVSLRRWTGSGELACLRVGPKNERRFRQEDLQAYLQKNAVPKVAANGHVLASRVTHVDIEGIAVEDGSHICSVYQSDLGRVKLAVPFLSDGLSNGEQCFLVAGEQTTRHILETLKATCGNLGDKIANGNLAVLNGEASAAEMYAYFEKALVEGTRAGRKSMRILGDMAWALDRGLSIEELIEFELRFNQFLAHQFPVVSLCQYDARRFPGVAILDALKCHDDTFKYPLGRFLN